MKAGRDWWLPLLVGVLVVGFVAYLWVQGRSHGTEFAVTRSGIRFVDADAPVVPEPLREDAPSDRLMLVDVSWEAVEAVAGGSYHVVVTAPPGWRSYACEPSCDFETTDDLTRWARQLPRATYPLSAQFPADEEGSVTVAFSGPAGDRPAATFSPTAWLVQTDGDSVLGARVVR